MIVLFVIGGVSGFMTASVPVDWQLTDTYFVVAHIHYVLIGINVFPVVGGMYFWFPKMTGRMLDERLGKLNFWTMFIGFNLAFLPMHLTGLLGMPRRVYTYGAYGGWGTLNLITSIGSFVFAFGLLLLFVNVMKSRKCGAAAGANPWDADRSSGRYPRRRRPTTSPSSRQWPRAIRCGRAVSAKRGSVSSIDRGMLLTEGKQTIGTTGRGCRAGHGSADGRRQLCALLARGGHLDHVRRAAAEEHDRRDHRRRGCRALRWSRGCGRAPNFASGSRCMVERRRQPAAGPPRWADGLARRGRSGACGR